MLTEATIIVPRATNDGLMKPNVLEWAIHQAIDFFGGVSVHEVRGYWRDDDQLYIDHNDVLTIACEHNADSMNKLRFIAAMVQRKMEQECVYIRYASGEVEFYDYDMKQDVYRIG